MGELALSRSVGDPEYKGNLKNAFWERNFEADLVVCDPEITTIEIGTYSYRLPTRVLLN